MKRIVLIFLFSLSYFHFFGQKDSIYSFYPFLSTPTIYDHFLTFSDSLERHFSGIINVLDSSGGELISLEKEYLNGQKIKVTGWYNNGQKYRETSFKNCQRNGLDTKWFKNGNKEFQCLYNEDIRITPSVSWYENGTIHDYSDEINNDSRFWYKNGQLEIVSRMIDSEKNAFYECKYYENGNIWVESIYNYGIQRFVSNYKNGQKHFRGNIYGSLFSPTGNWQEWYESGVMKREYSYTDTLPIFPIGTWSWWDESGELTKREFYKDGALIDQKIYKVEIRKPDD